MPEYDNTNRGVLFKNDKGNNPKRPDYRGSANWNGAEFNISGWVKESKKDGSKFLSNIMTVLAESRFALAVYQPNRFCSITSIPNVS